MKKRARNILTVSFALLLSLVMGLSIMTGARETKASSTSPEYNDEITWYSEKTILIPYDLISYVRFVQTLDYTYSDSATVFNMATVYVFQRYPYEYDATLTPVYLSYVDEENIYLNGLCYYPNALYYRTYYQGNYATRSYQVYSSDGFNVRYIAIEFEDLSSLDVSYYQVIDHEYLLNNGAYVMPSISDSHNEFYAQLGMIMGAASYQDGVADGIQDVQDNPNDYGLYSQDELDTAVREAVENTNAAPLNFGNVMRITFDGMANLLDQELFPGVTIGIVIGLPILLTILMVILKIVRG